MTVWEFWGPLLAFVLGGVVGYRFCDWRWTNAMEALSDADLRYMLAAYRRAGRRLRGKRRRGRA